MKRWQYYLWRGLPVVLAVAGVLALGYWWWSTTLPDYRLRRAFEAIERDDVQSAERAALQLEADGYANHARLVRGKMLFHDRKFLAALAELNQMNDQGELRIDAATLSGRCQLELGNSVEAQRVFLFVVSERPDSVDAHRGLAAAYFNQGARPRAIEHNEKWAKLAPRDGRPERWIGFIYRDMEMWEQAIPHYQEALRRDLTPIVTDEVRLELAECHIKRGEFAEALKIVEESAPQAWAEVAKKLTLRAECERALNRSTDAAASLEQALALAPKFVPALSLRASLLLDSLAFDKAATLLERAVELDPFDFVARERLAQAYSGLGHKDKAETQRQKMRETQQLWDEVNKLQQPLMSGSRDPAVYLRLAEVLDKLDRKDEAERARRTARLLGAPELKPAEKK